MGTSCSTASIECRRCIDSSDGTLVLQNTRLVEAARAGDTLAVQSTIRDGASVNATDVHGWSALHYSSANGNLEVCKALIDHCSDVNSTLPDFSTPLMLAVEEGHLSIAKFLLDNGALPKCKDEDGFTALDRCDARIKAEVIKLLQMPVTDCYRKVEDVKWGR
mmetsp:Transcript_27326/g.62991  ORF Transcript_27326/g.62991 Transcript_27326/m.62991 type:complete len:163 (+) Transcript_27326:82-570(+)